MRDLLTGLAILVIVVLTTILVAPYFIDWNAQRGLLEAQLTRAFGQTVTIGGNIDLKLLPTPYLRLNHTVIGADDGPLRVGIRHLDLELAVAPLLYGEIDVVEGHLDEPTIRLSLRADRSLPVLPAPSALAASLRFERLTVSDGTVAIADPTSGRTFVFDHLDMTGEAPSLDGPIKANGSVGDGAARTRFHIATTEARRGRTHLHLATDASPTHAGFDLDGTLAFVASGPDLTPSFTGKIVAAGAIAGALTTSASPGAAAAPLPWRLAGPLGATPARLALGPGELRLGTDDAALTLAAAGTVALASDTAISVTLKASQLDVDRLSGPPSADKPPHPPQMPDLATLRHAVNDNLPPLPLTVDLAVTGAVWGGEAIDDVHAHAHWRNAHLASTLDDLAVSGGGPGGTHLDLAATDNGLWSGTFDFSVADVPPAVRWLHSVDARSTLRADELPFSSMVADGTLTSAGDALSIRDLRLALDHTRFTGTAQWLAADGQVDSKPKLTLDLATSSLQFGSLPNSRALVGHAAPFDLDLKLAAATVAVEPSGGTAPLSGGPLTLTLSKAGRQMQLKTFRVDVPGGRLDAHGSISPGSLDLSAQVDAPEFASMAAVFEALVPGAAEALKDRAVSLSPAKLDFGAVLDTPAKGRVVPRRLDIGGTLGGTALDVHLSAADKGAIGLTAKAGNADGMALLRQLGSANQASSPGAAAPGLGRGSIELSANGRWDQPLDATLHAAFGDTRFGVTGRFNLFDGSSGGSGTMSLKSSDLAPLLRSAAVGPVEALRIPADLSGGFAASPTGLAFSALRGSIADTSLAGTLKWQIDAGDEAALTGSLDLGRLSMPALLDLVLDPRPDARPAADWSTAPFAATTGRLPATAVKIRANSLDLSKGLAAQDATMDVALGPGLLKLDRVDAAFRGGRIGGDLSLRRDGSAATLAGSLTASMVGIALPSLSATLSGKLSLAGGGASAASLVASLAGSGQAQLANVVVPRADAAALPRVFAELEDDTLAVDDMSIGRALDQESTGPFTQRARSYDLGLASGILHVAPSGPNPPPAADTGVSSVLDATVDLRRLLLGLELTDTLHALPKDWSGLPPHVVLDLSGPIAGAPQRHWNTGGLIDAVAARAIARESARIEAFEVDVRERAFLNEQMQSERRRVLDRAKAEADLLAAERKAEAERRAAREAAAAREAERKAADAAAHEDAAAPADQPPASNPPDAPARTPAPEMAPPSASSQGTPQAAPDPTPN